MVKVEDGVTKMTNIVEKPGKENAPSGWRALVAIASGRDFHDYLNKAKKNLTATAGLRFSQLCNK